MTHAHAKRTQRRIALGLSALLFALLSIPRGAGAMTISPPILDFTLNPGDVVSDVVQIYNEEEVPFKIMPVAVNFQAKEDDETSGSPQFYPKDEVRNGYELATWFELGTEPMVIAPNERVNVPFNIRVPEDAAPGSRFGAIQIMASRPDEVLGPDSSSVEIERGTSVLVFVRVSGDVRDELAISTFAPEKEALSHLPVDFDIRLANGGTTHQRPTGNVIIEDMFGRQVASLVVNPGPSFRTVLPGSARRFDLSWFRRKLPAETSEYGQQLRNFAFGKYTATLLVNYGSPTEQKSLTAVTTFVVIPWLALATYAGAVIVLLCVIVGAGRAYNKLIIRRYESAKKQGKA